MPPFRWCALPPGGRLMLDRSASTDRRTLAEPQPLLPLQLRGLGLTMNGAALLDNIDLTLGPVGCTVVMGANGAGKSVLLRVLHGLIEPTQGNVDWNGISTPEALPRQAMVFQKPVLFRRSVEANINMILKARGKKPSTGHNLLERVGLGHKASQPARLLSGGEAQRLALARALATDPEVLFLDEPTANLDPASTLAIERITKTASENGTHIIFVTHDAAQARRLADDVVFLHRGRVAEHTKAKAFFARPRTQQAQDYLNGKIVA